MLFSIDLWWRILEVSRIFDSDVRILAPLRISPRTNRLPRLATGRLVRNFPRCHNKRPDGHTNYPLIYTRRGDMLVYYGLRRFTLRLKFNWNIKNFNGGRGVKTIALLSTEEDDRINNELRRFLFANVDRYRYDSCRETRERKEMRDSFTVIRNYLSDNERRRRASYRTDRAMSLLTPFYRTSN